MLACLDLSGNLLKADGVAHLAKGLASNESVSALHLARNDICAAGRMHGLLALCELLGGSSSITALDLSSNALTCGAREFFGVRKLIDVLPRSKLKSLNVDDNLLTLDVAAKLTEAAGEECKVHACEVIS